MSHKALTAAAALMAASSAAHAQIAQTIDEAINTALSPISDFVAGIIFYSVPIAGVSFPLIVGWLILAATVFTLYFGFIQFRGFKHSIDVVRGRYDNPKDAGEVSRFQALTTALSATVGLGNIAGIAVAVSIGGAGATFWMILAGLMGMASKFTEVTLGVKYRKENPDGTVSGGPMYYLSRGFAEIGKPGLGRFFAIFFSICCIGGAVGGGNMFQANQAFQQVVNVTGGEASFLADKGWLFGLVLASIVGMVIIGGIKSIARVTEKIVPVMAAIYLGAGLVIILMNIDMVGWAFTQIVVGAFSPEGVAGGAIGALIQGFRRAAHLGGLRDSLPVVPGGPRGSGGAFRFLDDDRVVVLRAQVLDLPRRREQVHGKCVQALLLRVRGGGGEHEPRPGDRLLRFDDFRDGLAEYHRSLPADAGGQA